MSSTASASWGRRSRSGRCQAIKAYELAPRFEPTSSADFLRAHGTLMAGLAQDAGRWRACDVGVIRGTKVGHIAPGAPQVPALMAELFDYLAADVETPTFVKACVAHYEIEFIHPFSDGNGRMGRLWQHVMLLHESPVFGLVPTESVSRSTRGRTTPHSGDRIGPGTRPRSSSSPRGAEGGAGGPAGEHTAPAPRPGAAAGGSARALRAARVLAEGLPGAAPGDPDGDRQSRSAGGDGRRDAGAGRGQGDRAVQVRQASEIFESAGLGQRAGRGAEGLCPCARARALCLRPGSLFGAGGRLGEAGRAHLRARRLLYGRHVVDASPHEIHRDIAAAALPAGCVSPASTICSDGRACPANTRCDVENHRCTPLVTPAEETACQGHAAGAACQLLGAPGTCMADVCQPLRCGDGVRSGVESCDGTDLNNKTCADLDFYGQTTGLGCKGDCTFDMTGCVGTGRWKARPRDRGGVRRERYGRAPVR